MMGHVMRVYHHVTCGLHIKFPMSNQKYAHQEWQPDPACIFLPGFFSSSPFATCVQKYSFINRPPEEEAKWKCATHQAHMHHTNFHSPAFVFPLSTCVCVCVCVVDWWKQTGDFAATTGILPSCAEDPRWTDRRTDKRTWPDRIFN